MLEVSMKAATYVDEVRRRFELPATAGLRVWMEQSPEAAVRVGLSEEPDVDDDVVEAFGARVFVAGNLADALDGHVLDVDVAAEPPHLVLRREE